MISVKKAFQEKCDDIDKYFLFLEKIDKYESFLRYRNKRKNYIHKKFDLTLKLILKSTVYLLLYNMIESTIKSGFLAIYDAIKIDRLTLKEVNEKIRAVWLKNETKTRNLNDKDIDDIKKDLIEMFEYALNEITLEMNNERHLNFSQNLDADKIFKLCYEYGFKPKVPGIYKGGEDLEKIRDQRNFLAHGNKSFTQSGREHTFSELMEMKKQVFGFLKNILKNIEEYIDYKEYKFKPVETLQSPSISPSNNPPSPSSTPI